MSIVRLKRKGKGAGTWGEVQFDRSWHRSQTWVQALRRPGKHAVVCFDGYLSTDWSDETEGYYQRAAVQHLALFVPWESFLSEGAGDINAIWERQKRALSRRISFAVDNIQLLHRSAEDAKRDARQWAAQSGDGDGDPGVDTARRIETGNGENRDNCWVEGNLDDSAATEPVSAVSPTFCGRAAQHNSFRERTDDTE
ncbi:hypothetical protein H9Q72_008069 [Fusarium xylarioides]|uniref:Uncharacterized protein n=1 Tax=Fusarium xylarioides TaxID=221167 RepID=A0A9P7L4E7_9HYPO|nr:hypothetical protein H9Q70_011272 [Fusarium xylarioides]KAG5763852.1 hypothetical protein H9Q72_008069 [Fusarium xylarioides]KAG5778222.1 hypothetical protein H9Q73_008108 [Fusarium xylarioides]